MSQHCRACGEPGATWHAASFWWHPACFPTTWPYSHPHLFPNAPVFTEEDARRIVREELAKEKRDDN